MLRNTYRIYSRKSRGFLDNFLVKKRVGHGFKVYNMKEIQNLMLK